MCCSDLHLSCRYRSSWYQRFNYIFEYQIESKEDKKYFIGILPGSLQRLWGLTLFRCYACTRFGQVCDSLGYPGYSTIFLKWLSRLGYIAIIIPDYTLVLMNRLRPDRF